MPPVTGGMWELRRGTLEVRRGTLAVVATFVPAFIPLEKPVSNPSFPCPSALPGGNSACNTTSQVSLKARSGPCLSLPIKGIITTFSECA